MNHLLVWPTNPPHLGRTSSLHERLEALGEELDADTEAQQLRAMGCRAVLAMKRRGNAKRVL